ncbi:hypothetical protein FKR81_17130 [Lentzea tibetensis]|uniref:SH3 domain-containing protein n=1 Tax=Lentzea tibetensis TaxID=2591470 RepID=A0A563EUI0_9PSEU|nr:hypothetical protein [Lentzea tibetensis]TWP51330.1 hypothetical protein FKR81_17130 [Lentzea tibetensis]
MNKLVRLVTATALTTGAISALFAIGASPASAAGCDVFVVTENAYVRENPSEDSVVRKTKYAGEEVRSCFGSHGGDLHWTPVNCSCASDGVGYIVTRKLRWLRYEG